MAVSPFCTQGHLRTERPNGDLVCRVCHNANRDRRDRNRAAGGAPGPSVPSGERCVRGHKKVRRINGDLSCQWCAAAKRREVRRLEQDGQCPHVGRPGFEGVLSLDCRLVCLGCVAEAMAA